MSISFPSSDCPEGKYNDENGFNCTGKGGGITSCYNPSFRLPFVKYILRVVPQYFQWCISVNLNRFRIVSVPSI